VKKDPVGFSIGEDGRGGKKKKKQVEVEGRRKKTLLFLSVL